MEGLVLRSKYGNASVYSEGVLYNVRSRGILRHTSKDVVAGDIVSFSLNDLVIDEVKQRKNKLARPLVANIDQLALVLSFRKPDYSYELIFRLITYANMNDLPSVIIMTKSDLVNDKQEIEHLKDLLSKIHIESYVCSSKTNEGIEEVKKALQGKITALFGLTGVGKSSLLNAIDKNYKRTVGEFSIALKQGKHETKETILLPLGNNAYIADTPGFSSLKLEIYKEDLAKFFPMFQELSLKCYYSDCLHISEPNCNVKESVREEIISKEMYDYYIRLSDSLESRNRRFDK